jgi:O-antigen/teichoic acid export membrane protein
VKRAADERSTDEGATSEGALHRALYQGFGNALGTAVELALTPALFALAGLWIDRRYSTGHVFTIALFLFAVVGLAVRYYYSYTDEMKKAEEAMPWKRSR